VRSVRTIGGPRAEPWPETGYGLVATPDGSTVVVGDFAGTLVAQGHPEATTTSVGDTDAFVVQLTP